MTTSATTLPRRALTDRWIVFYRPCGFWAPPGGVTNPANWGGEQRLTTSSFDLEQAPNIEGQTLSGYFLGDDQGLAAQGDRFLSLFTVAGTNGPGTASIDFDRSDTPRSMKPTHARRASARSPISHRVLSLVKLSVVATVALSKVRPEKF